MTRPIAPTITGPRCANARTLAPWRRRADQRRLALHHADDLLGRSHRYPKSAHRRPACGTDDPNALVMVTTGHVDGDPGLGWGDPRSDFFAMPADAAAALAALFGKFNRVWQYRIYDTVNDPAGQVRGWLAENGQLPTIRCLPARRTCACRASCLDRPRQRRQIGRPPHSGRSCPCTWDRSPAKSPAARRSTRRWSGNSPAAPTDFATSIRLIGPDGAIWAQPPDERPFGPMLPASQWTEDQAYRQTLKLPVPAGTPPGQYAVELVVYDPATGQPWPAQAGDLALTPNGLRLGEVTVLRTDPSPTMQPTLATFGPLALIEATSPVTEIAPGGQVPVDLLWQAAEAPVEPLVVVVQLQEPPVASSPGWRRSRSTAAIPRRTGPPANSCVTGTPSRCRPTWRRTRTG